MNITVNFKNYRVGKAAVELAKTIEKYLGKKRTICIKYKDIKNIRGKSNLQIYSQYLEKSPRELRKSGCHGTLLNHSDYKLPIKVLKKEFKKCRDCKLKVILCVSSVKQAKELLFLKPEVMAFEDPKYIGTGKSITSYNSRDVKAFVALLKGKKIKPYCGAGISSIEDVKEARKLGCKGVLISSAIANNKNPSLLLRELKKI